MTRDQRFEASRWRELRAIRKGIADKVAAARLVPAVNKDYEPQFEYERVGDSMEWMLLCYSSGDPIADLKQHFLPLLDAWERAEKLGTAVWSPEVQRMRHSWADNISFYNRCFWLIGLALSLELEELQWQRLLKLIGNAGQDALLDRVIATRQPGRAIGTKLCHPKPYARLLAVLDAPAAQQPALLRDFVSNWYAELDRAPKKGLSKLTNLEDRPSWYENHTGISSYFGYWCLEAVAVVKAFGVDDSLCLGHPNYPGDLLRPNGPTTHLAPAPAEQVTAAGRPSLLQKLRSAF